MTSEPAALLATLATLSTTSLIDAAPALRVLPHEIRPIVPGRRFAGRVVTARADRDLRPVIAALRTTEAGDVLVVDTMHERKRLMAEHADAFLALPGGIGTFEEFFEVWTWRQLGYHDKPVGLLNQNGYYDLLVTFLQSTVTQGFMGDWQMGLIRIGDQAED